MNYTEAVELFFKKNSKAEKTLLAIIKWDSSETNIGNAKKIGISIESARFLRRKYGVEQERKKIVRINNERDDQIEQAVIDGHHYRAISKKFNITISRVHQIIKSRRGWNSFLPMPTFKYGERVRLDYPYQVRDIKFATVTSKKDSSKKQTIGIRLDGKKSSNRYHKNFVLKMNEFKTKKTS